MNKGRLEAFSDGVIAVIITIMVLEMKTPHGANLEALRPNIPVLLSYVLSYVYIGIYWSNHHHLMHAAKHVNGAVLWANLHLLFWLSLVPFVTSWMGANNLSSTPVAVYGAVLLLAGIAYYILTRTLIRYHGPDSVLAKSIGADIKGISSLVIYAAAIALAFARPWISCVCYVLVALMWLVPDRRIERRISDEMQR